MKILNPTPTYHSISAADELVEHLNADDPNWAYRVVVISAARDMAIVNIYDEDDELMGPL